MGTHFILDAKYMQYTVAWTELKSLKTNIKKQKQTEKNMNCGSTRACIVYVFLNLGPFVCNGTSSNSKNHGFFKK